MKLRNYVLVTAGYWVFTLTDGALRMLVLLHFNSLGYSAAAIAFLFLLYEFMGIVTNLVGGWVGSLHGLNRTLVAGLALQVLALLALSAQDQGWTRWFSVAWVMVLQALAGVAKDLTKMSSKSAVKTVAGDGSLFRLVAVLTGSKNALKGVGFFLGAALLSWLGYRGALWAMAGALGVTAIAVAVLLTEDIGRAKRKKKVTALLSPSPAINRLAAARLFLFGARDIWFVVALPVFLTDRLGWSHRSVGAFLACWVIGYGIAQAGVPRLAARSGTDEVHAAQRWALVLLVVSVALAALIALDVAPTATVIIGLFGFGVAFAVNSSLHSYLVLAYADDDAVATDVGFYYSANAAGRLIGTLLSGLLYLAGGLALSLWGTVAFVALTWLLAQRLAPLPAGLRRSFGSVDAGD
jgi:predicted MFS family arabinose efflux permease